MSSARTNVRLLLSSNSCSCQAKFEHLFDMGREDALMSRKITKRQQQIYDFIKEYQQEKGYPPSVREMASAVGLSSPSTVHAHLSALEARGLLKRDATKPRALELFNEDGSSVSISKSTARWSRRGWDSHSGRAEYRRHFYYPDRNRH